MRIYRLLFAFIVVLAAILLGIPVLVVRHGGRPPAPQAPASSAPPEQAVVPAEGVGRIVQEGELPVNIYVNDQKKLLRIPLEEYLKGVVAAEMPADFATEALKAQAVVARTYTVYRMRVFGGQGCKAHPAADVCTDTSQGQAWQSEDALRKKWGALKFPFYWRKISQAVESTRGKIVTYDGEPIEAVYHAASGGRTEDAVAVWGRAVPYLRSVASPYETVPQYEGKKTKFTLKDLSGRTGVPVAVLERSRNKGLPALQVLERSESGRALRVRVGDTEFTGREIREKLGLPSTLFLVRVVPDGVEIETRGYGHGVGLSQHGANGLAKRGRSYEEIIYYYYPGTHLRPIFTE